MEDGAWGHGRSGGPRPGECLCQQMDTNDPVVVPSVTPHQPTESQQHVGSGPFLCVSQLVAKPCVATVPHEGNQIIAGVPQNELRCEDLRPLVQRTQRITVTLTDPTSLNRAHLQGDGGSERHDRTLPLENVSQE